MASHPSSYRWASAVLVILGVAWILSGRTWPPPAAASIGPGAPENVNVTCGTSPTPIKPASKAMLSVTCECDAAVSFGDSGVDSSMDYSKNEFSGNVRSLYCDAGSSTPCRCLAMVP